MKLATLTASPAALLLLSTAAFAQQDPAQEFSNVYIDVGGTAVQVPVAQAAEACALDEATLQQIAQTRLSESGLDPAVVYGMGNETGAVPTDTADSGAPPLNEAGTTGDTASADAGATMDSSDAAAGSDMASAEAAGGMESSDANAATADASGTAGSVDSATGTASADASGTVDSTTGAAGTTGSTDVTATATADASGTAGDMASGVENVESTAADTATGGGTDPMLQLAVCQVDQARAIELGIDMSGAGAMGTTETTGATAAP